MVKQSFDKQVERCIDDVERINLKYALSRNRFVFIVLFIFFVLYVALFWGKVAGNSFDVFVLVVLVGPFGFIITLIVGLINYLMKRDKTFTLKNCDGIKPVNRYAGLFLRSWACFTLQMMAYSLKKNVLSGAIIKPVREWRQYLIMTICTPLNSIFRD